VVKSEHETRIARSPEAAFDFFADLRNEPEWNHAHVHDVRMTSPPPIGQGTTFEGRHPGFGTATWQLVEYDRPRHLVIEGFVGKAPYRYVGATAKTAPDGWESLGDLGYLDDEGFVYLTDRDADMILVGGANVYPAEVEAALDEYPAVRSSCVIGLPHEDLGSVPHALVELVEPTSDDVLLAHLGERLAPYKLPRSIERVDEPLRDDAGKVRRSALRTARLTGS